MQRIASLCAIVCAIVPFVSARGVMDLPKELVMDTNKSTAAVNIIAEPSDNNENAEILTSMRRSFIQAPVTLKVAASSKVAASDKLLSALSSEFRNAIRSEVSYFLRALNRKHSFLGSEVNVNPQNMKNSLYLTQPLRTPSAANINVVQHEHISGTAATGQRSAANYLRAQFRRDLIDLKA